MKFNDLNGKLFLLILLIFSPIAIYTLFSTYTSIILLSLFMFFMLVYLIFFKVKNKFLYLPLFFYLFFYIYILFSVITKSGIIAGNSLDGGMFIYLLLILILFSAPLIINASIALIVLNNKNKKILNKRIFGILQIVFFLLLIILPIIFQNIFFKGL